MNELENTCDKVFVEGGVSARKKNRPVFRKLLSELNAGDVLVVISYERAFRSVVDGLSTLDKLTEKSVQLESISQCFDSTTPDGRLFFNMTITVGEWELGINSWRTIHGLEAAVKEGLI